MLILILALPILLVYLTIGAVFSRNNYAKLMFERTAEISSEESIKELRDSRRHWYNDGYYRHAPGCKAHTWTLEEYRCQYCNCTVYKVVAKLDRRLNGQVDEPSVIMPMLIWPGYIATAYLKGGTVKKPNYALISEMEKRELGIQD